VPSNPVEVRFVGQKPNTLYLGDWPWGREDEVFTTTELDSGVGGIPTVRGDGLMHRPHGSDWSSIGYVSNQ